MLPANLLRFRRQALTELEATPDATVPQVAPWYFGLVIGLFTMETIVGLFTITVI